jgi:hypothetical protein
LDRQIVFVEGEDPGFLHDVPWFRKDLELEMSWGLRRGDRLGPSHGERRRHDVPKHVDPVAEEEVEAAASHRLPV